MTSIAISAKRGHSQDLLKGENMPPQGRLPWLIFGILGCILLWLHNRRGDYKDICELLRWIEYDRRRTYELIDVLCVKTGVDLRPYFGKWAKRDFAQSIQEELSRLERKSFLGRLFLDYDELGNHYRRMREETPYDLKDVYGLPPLPEGGLVTFLIKRREEEKKTGTLS